jgi:hypothetical protein
MFFQRMRWTSGEIKARSGKFKSDFQTYVKNRFGQNGVWHFRHTSCLPLWNADHQYHPP